MTSEVQHPTIQQALDAAKENVTVPLNVDAPSEGIQETEEQAQKRGVGRPRKEEPKPKLGIFRLHNEITLPKFHTDQAACFDLAYAPWGKSKYEGYSSNNAKFERFINQQTGALFLAAGDRVMVPTGLIFDIPVGYSLRIHPRSGLSLKNGLIMANCEGVIDSDFFHETFVLLRNTSINGATIMPGERVAQAELVKNEVFEFVHLTDAPKQRTNRTGGYGSTGGV